MNMPPVCSIEIYDQFIIHTQNLDIIKLILHHLHISGLVHQVSSAQPQISIELYPRCFHSYTNQQD
jgi:hypothetical protein